MRRGNREEQATFGNKCHCQFNKTNAFALSRHSEYPYNSVFRLPIMNKYKSRSPSHDPRIHILDTV
jgi:hypothetical protein